MAALPSRNKYIPADDDEDDIDDASMPAFSQPQLELDEQPTPRANTLLKGKGRAPPDLLSGNIGGPSAGASTPAPAGGPARASTRQNIGGIQVETRYSGVDTLDEPVLTTIGRDLFSIYTKLVQVLYPARSSGNREVLRDWDLWGPLILCLGLAIMLSVNAPPAQSLGVFTSVVVIVSLGSLIVTVNAKLLGGRVSFFQSLCVLGYCTAPLVIAALVATFVRVLYVRGPVAVAALGWSIWAAMNFLDGTKIEEQRVMLAVYPIILFYFVLAWMILIQ